MGNMSYCRFENTARDLKDCVQAINNGEMNAMTAQMKAFSCQFLSSALF